jgi:hypothetical protein
MLDFAQQEPNFAAAEPYREAVHVCCWQNRPPELPDPFPITIHEPNALHSRVMLSGFEPLIV